MQLQLFSFFICFVIINIIIFIIIIVIIIIIIIIIVNTIIILIIIISQLLFKGVQEHYQVRKIVNSCSVDIRNKSFLIHSMHQLKSHTVLMTRGYFRYDVYLLRITRNEKNPKPMLLQDIS